MSQNLPIDAHMHVDQWYAGDLDYFTATRRYLAKNKLGGVDIMCCTNNKNLWSGYEPDQNILAAICKLEVPETYIHGCLYIPSDPRGVHGNCKGEPLKSPFTPEEQLEDLYEIGFDGMKICEGKPDSYVVHDMDSRMDEYEQYLAWCENHDFPMCWHIADPEYFWRADTPNLRKVGWYYGEGDYPSFEKLIDLTENAIARHPKLRIMLAHAFFHSHYPDYMRRLFEKYPHVSMDLAPGGEMFDGYREHYDEWERIFNDYSDRICFATDADMRNPDRAGMLCEKVMHFLTTRDTFDFPGDHIAHGIGLTGKALADITGDNVRRELGAPRAINRAALARYIEKMLPVLHEGRNKAEIVRYAEHL